MDAVSNNPRRRSKGLIRELILKALEEGEKTGSELLEISLRAGYDKNTHYYHLRKLIDEGIVEVEKINRRENKYRLKTKESVLRPLSDSDIALLREVAKLGDVEVTLRLLVKLLRNRSEALNNKDLREILIDTIKKLPSIDPKKVDKIRSNVGSLPNVIFENNPDESLLKDLERVSKNIISYVINELKTLEENGVIQVERSSIKYHSKDQNIVKKLLLIYYTAVDLLTKIYMTKNDLELLRYLVNKYFDNKLYVFDHIFNDLIRSAVKDEHSRDLIKEECLKRLKENPDEVTKDMAASILETLLGV